MTLKKALALSFVVTMSAMALDMMFHMATGVAVHLPYVLVKVAVVWFTLVLAYWWLGWRLWDGIVWSMGASILFDIYYNFAEPTLDRTVFTLDEATFFIAVHFFCIVIPFLALYKYGMDGLNLSGKNISTGWLYKIIGVGAIFGALGLFPSKAFLKSSGLLLGLSYNDHVLIGTLFVIAALVAGYKLVFKK